jgi:hypothetical protein
MQACPGGGLCTATASKPRLNQSKFHFSYGDLIIHYLIVCMRVT